MPEYEVIADIPEDVDDFTRGYLECAEWCGIDSGNECGGWCRNCDNPDETKRCKPSDRSRLESADAPTWSKEAVRQAIEDCRAFREANAIDLYNVDDSQAGHDFWLTRNRHGAGFWDGDYPADAGKRLTDAAHMYGEVNVWFNAETELIEFDA